MLSQGIDNIEDIPGYLIRSIRNTWIDKKRRDVKITYNNDTLIEQDQGEFVDILMDDEKKQFFDDVLNAAGDSCKKLLNYVIVHHYTMKEVAEKLGYANSDTVKTQVYKCKKKLIKRFKDNTTLRDILKRLMQTEYTTYYLLEAIKGKLPKEKMDQTFHRSRKRCKP